MSITNPPLLFGFYSRATKKRREEKLQATPQPSSGDVYKPLHFGAYSAPTDYRRLANRLNIDPNIDKIVEAVNELREKTKESEPLLLGHVYKKDDPYEIHWASEVYDIRTV